MFWFDVDVDRRFESTCTVCAVCAKCFAVCRGDQRLRTVWSAGGSTCFTLFLLCCFECFMFCVCAKQSCHQHPFCKIAKHRKVWKNYSFRIPKQGVLKVFTKFLRVLEAYRGWTFFQYAFCRTSEIPWLLVRDQDLKDYWRVWTIQLFCDVS